MSVIPDKGFSKALRPLYKWLKGNTGLGNGSLPAVTGLTVTHEGAGDYRRTVLKFTNVAIPLTDQAGVVAYKGTKIWDFPEGAILFLGASANIVLTKSSTGVIATWAGLFSVGSVIASNNATLTSTEQDMIPSTVTPAATAGVGAAKGLSTSTESAKVFNGSATPLDAYINLLVNDTDHDVTTTPCNLILNGTLILNWVNLGDI